MIARHADGILLDCGAGQRNVYHDNVVNCEIVDYDSTDLTGISEKLPFKDSTVDGVISIAVLEQVRDPFASAAEMVRVLKPGGDIACEVPFL
jgi:predicted SAM-dependent methyltransferase